MRKLSTGHDSTLGGYLELCKITFGEESFATKFVQQMIDDQSADAEVIQDEAQMAYMLVQRHLQPKENIVVGNAF